MRRQVLAASVAALLLTGATLPDTVPVPQTKPKEAESTAIPDKPAVPEPKPDRDKADGATRDPSTPAQDSSTKDQTTTDRGSASDNPDRPPDDNAGEKQKDNPGNKADSGEAEKTEPKISAIVPEDPVRLEACISDLRELGARFEPQETIRDDDGVCGIEKPIVVTEPLPNIRLSEPFPMRCEAALALSRWLKDTVQPVLKIAMPSQKLTGVRNAASYVCRKRNGAETGKISEHARGNAIDIIALELDDKKLLPMTPMAEDPTIEGAVQRTITAGACLHFTTVLSPGSDATHEDHLHMDVLARNAGYRYCR